METGNLIALSDVMERIIQGTQAVWAISEGMALTEDRFGPGLNVVWSSLDQAVQEAQELLDRALEEARRREELSVTSVRVSA